MESDPVRFREVLWRRRPTAAERPGLAAHPELELEARLTEALSRLPETPVPSNFTAQVMASVDRAEERGVRSKHWALNWRAWLPRVAMTAGLLVFLGLGLQRYAAQSQQAALVKSLAQIAVIEPLPKVEALENLEAIQRLTQSSHADADLLATLQ